MMNIRGLPKGSPLATLQHHKPKTTKMKERGELLGCSYDFVNNQRNDAKLEGWP
jgi:hypothetical protein